MQLDSLQKMSKLARSLQIKNLLGYVNIPLRIDRWELHLAHVYRREPLVKISKRYCRQMFVWLAILLSLQLSSSSDLFATPPSPYPLDTANSARDLTSQEHGSYPETYYDDECDFIRRQIKTGATIELPYDTEGDGVYNCKGPIVIDRNHVTLRGVGDEPPVLRLADRTVSPLLIVGSIRTGDRWDTTDRKVEHVVVENLVLDGNRFGQISLEGVELKGDSAGRVIEKGIIAVRQARSECWARDPFYPEPCDRAEWPVSKIRNNGITIRGAQFVRILNIVTHSNLSGGLVTEKFSSHILVDGFESYNNFFDGLAGYDTENSVFRNMNLHHNRASGISLDLRFDNNVIVDSASSFNLDNGLFARESRNNKIIQLDIEDACNNGVFLAGLEDEPNHGGTINYYFEELDISAVDRGFHIADASCTGTTLSQRDLGDISAFAEDISGHPQAQLRHVAWVEGPDGITRLKEYAPIDFATPGLRSHKRTRSEVWQQRLDCRERNRSTPFLSDLRRGVYDILSYD